MRTILEAEIIAIKGATEAGIVHGGGYSVMAAFTRVNVPALSKYASVTRVIEPGGQSRLEHGDKVVPLDIAVEIDRRARHPWIVGEAARLLGYRLEPLNGAPRMSPISERDAHVIMAEAMDASRVILAAFDDGRLDAVEKRQLKQELRELIRAAQQVLERIDGE